jgi:hypothetical protein
MRILDHYAAADQLVARAQYHQRAGALRLSQRTDLAKKTTADALLYVCRMKDEERNQKLPRAPAALPDSLLCRFPQRD